jgi:hypothetical protein
MTIWDVDKLADEIARVATRRLGWSLRKGVNTDQLRLMAQALTDKAKARSDDFLLYETALRSSIERLGPGPMGRLAQIEFGLTEESADMSFLKQRRALARTKLGIRPNAIEGRERDMHLAIARDLVFRWEASQPAKKNSYIENRLEERYPGMSAEERSREEFLATLRRFADRVARQEEEEIMAGEITKEEIEEYENAPDELTDLERRWQKQTEERR